MLKKIKENQYIKWISEFLKIPRAKATVQLVLWIIFFIIVFAAFDIRKSQPPKKILDMWDVSEYSYQATFQVNQDKFLLTGTKKENTETIQFENQEYRLEQNRLYLIQENQVVQKNSTELVYYDIRKLNLNFFKTIVSNAALEYTTNYESGLIRKGYSLNTAKFVEFYSGMSITDDSTIQIETVEEAGVLKEIEFDLTPFQKYNQKIINTYQIKIVYSKIESQK